MQPVQLSLLPDLVPAPPVIVLAQLPDGHVAAAVMLLAGLIARAAAVPDAAMTREAGVSTGDEPKVTASHLRRPAVIYVRQSTLAQVEKNTESTLRQYDLTARAQALAGRAAACG